LQPTSKLTWRNKLNPLFVKSAEFNREVRTLAKSEDAYNREKAAQMYREGMPHLLAEADALADQMKEEAPPSTFGGPFFQALGIENPDPEADLSNNPEYFCRFLCFCRFGKTFDELNREYETGDRTAIEQMNKLSLECDLWKIGDVDPNRLQLKRDFDHFTLIACGIGLGVENLSGDELADFFDKCCPCDETEHSVENLNKLRLRITKQVRL
jgi:hypothetical protein